MVTRDFTIVSGHQRVRACRELGIEEIPARVRDYAGEDAVIKDLLETNVRQRGNDDGSNLRDALDIKLQLVVKLQNIRISGINILLTEKKVLIYLYQLNTH